MLSHSCPKSPHNTRTKAPSPCQAPPNPPPLPAGASRAPAALPNAAREPRSPQVLPLPWDHRPGRPGLAAPPGLGASSKIRKRLAASPFSELQGSAAPGRCPAL